MDYIEKYRKALRHGFKDDVDRSVRDGFYTNAKMDVSRAIIRGEITEAQDSLHDIIERRRRLTDVEKHNILMSDKTKEELAIEYNCSVAFVANLKKDNKV
jgi:hypothetical protein